MKPALDLLRIVSVITVLKIQIAIILQMHSLIKFSYLHVLHNSGLSKLK